MRTLYLANSQNNIEAYWKGYVRGFNSPFVEGKYIDKELLEKLTAEKYPLLRQFARQNNLSWSDVEDLSKILEYYGKLIEAGPQ